MFESLDLHLENLVYPFNRNIKHKTKEFVRNTSKKMAGIYLHIPFCKQKCHYCNFFSLASVKHKSAFVDAICNEIAMQEQYLEKEAVGTIYLGGGTPSMLSISELNRIIEKLRLHFNVSEKVEITLEANPDDLNADYLKTLHETEINRLSIGVQSFYDDDLTYLNRVHTSGHAIEAIELALKTGFDNLTIDLIYGIPTLTDEKWRNNIQRFLDFGINHLSAYALTVEAKTALSHLIGKGNLPPVDELQSIRHFKILMEMMEANGFVHYEISNFARPGFYSRHNSIYWLGGHYLGLGPSAHSFNGVSRQWNVSNLSQYLALKDTKETVFEKEILTMDQQYNEYVMTSLRTSWGCDLEHINNVFGKEFASNCENGAEKFIRQDKLIRRENRLFLTNTGKLFADGIASDLFR